MASTPLPPDEGENDHASEPTNLRLSDMQRLAELRPDGVAEGSPEISAPVFLSDGINGHASSTSVRSSDAEQIASQPLDGVAEGSPEVSAPVLLSDGINGDASSTSVRSSEAEQIAPEPLDGAAEGSPDVSTPVLPSDGVNGHAYSTSVRSSDAERIASQRLDGAAEGSVEEALAIVPIDTPPQVASSLVDRIDLVSDGLAAEPLEPPRDGNPSEASDQVPANASGPEWSAAAPVADEGGAIASEARDAAPSPTAAIADAGLTAQPTEALHEPAGDTSQIVAVAQSPHRGASGNVRPLASALDAAAKLAADANAAAEALENLKRLLERQLPNVAANKVRAATEIGTQQTSAKAPAAPMAPPQPPELPLHAVRDGSGRTTLRPAVLAPLPPRHAPERRRLDVRGFLAGFALSGAVGVVLYLLMTSG
jgi:hypothetical protein